MWPGGDPRTLPWMQSLVMANSMRVGVFGDTHDHVDNMRLAVSFFNEAGCGLVLFAGDFCSPLVVPPLRKLFCPVVSVLGDNDGNLSGIQSGMKILGGVAGGPVCCTAKDGTRFLLTHVLNDVRDCIGDANVVVFAHTHRPSVATDKSGRLFVNPGETSGWTSRKPTVAVVETDDLSAQIIPLPEMGQPPAIFGT